MADEVSTVDLLRRCGAADRLVHTLTTDSSSTALARPFSLRFGILKLQDAAVDSSMLIALGRTGVWLHSSCVPRTNNASGGGGGNDNNNNNAHARV
jgi:hypothetical protein